MLRAEFCERMKANLGGQYDAFMAALEAPPVRGLRINKIKSGSLGAESLPLSLSPIPYWTDGFFIEEGGEHIGNTPLHHSGAVYMQDPGAMSAVAALPHLKGPSLVLDLCAAPGGKTSQLAERLPQGSFLIANEYVRKRASILFGNIERLGIKNAAVISEGAEKIGKEYKSAFGAVLVDAPCSGEGMFRKGDTAREEWSPENVTMCAARQRDILNSISDTVCEGGYLLYSTCTYSIEENEAVVDEFLDTHRDFRLMEIENQALIDCTADGIQFPGAKCRELRLCRRFYPHIARGEGQFVALMRRWEAPQKKMPKDSLLPPTRDELSIVNAFLSENLREIPPGRIVKVGGLISLMSEGVPLPRFNILSAGVLLGEVRGRLFIPHHQLFSAYGGLFRRIEDITDEERALKYLRGEELDNRGGHTGYTAISYLGIPLGGGKASGSVIKNHYPKGLRLPPR